jgi:hypothetical protein
VREGRMAPGEDGWGEEVLSLPSSPLYRIERVES